jgi:DNA-binding PadR family transcriptional regulator
MPINRESSEVMPFFLLALVSKGRLETLYGLQQHAALQPGGVQPVLRQLEDKGLLKRSEEGKRRRRVMSVTEEGKKMLAEHWQSCLVFHSDIESVLRAATVAMLMEQPHFAHGYLLERAADYESKSKNLPAAGLNSSRSILDLYGSMRTGWETARLESAAHTLRGLADAVVTFKGVQ